MSTGTSQGQEHLSIGEVLEHLRDEFPDITISKIRFLESQGLIDPERTPSGYRKFYEADVARLRWILHQQKDNFLPLKVIKERLDDLGPEGVPPGPEPSGPRREGPKSTVGHDGGSSRTGRKPRKSRARATKTRAGRGAAALPIDDAEVDDAPAAGPSPESATFTRAELAQAAGLDEAAVAELEAHGLVTPTSRGERVLFDEEALAVAKVAAGFARHGIEARHLKIYKHSAEREVGLFEQVLLPYLRQRNPEARARAHEQLTDLARLGRALRSALLVAAVRESLSD